MDSEVDVVGPGTGRTRAELEARSESWALMVSGWPTHGRPGLDGVRSLSPGLGAGGGWPRCGTSGLKAYDQRQLLAETHVKTWDQYQEARLSGWERTPLIPMLYQPVFGPCTKSCPGIVCGSNKS
jgi:hypothetical protein